MPNQATRDLDLLVYMLKENQTAFRLSFGNTEKKRNSIFMSINLKNV